MNEGKKEWNQTSCLHDDVCSARIGRLGAPKNFDCFLVRQTLPTNSCLPNRRKVEISRGRKKEREKKTKLPPTTTRSLSLPNNRNFFSSSPSHLQAANAHFACVTNHTNLFFLFDFILFVFLSRLSFPVCHGPKEESPR